MKKIILLLPICVLLFACGEKTAETNSDSNEELEKLKKENEELKSELNSLKESLDEEAIEPFVWKSGICNEVKAGETVRFNIGMLYNRPNFYHSVYGKLFKGSTDDIGIVFDSIKPTKEFLLDTLLSEEELLKEDPEMAGMPFNQKALSAEFKNLKKGTYTFAGMIGVYRKNENYYKPFYYQLEVK